MLTEKASSEQYKYAACSFEQILGAAVYKTAVVWPLTSHRTENIQVRRTRYAAHCWRSSDQSIIDIIQETATYGHISAGPPAVKTLNTD